MSTMIERQSPKIGVKFCGGCNPVYNRRAVLDRFRRDYPEAIIRFVSEAPEGEITLRGPSGTLPDDVVILLCGCRNECFDYSEYLGRLGQILIFSEEDYCKVAAFMAEWKNNASLDPQ